MSAVEESLRAAARRVLPHPVRHLLRRARRSDRAQALAVRVAPAAAAAALVLGRRRPAAAGAAAMLAALGWSGVYAVNRRGGLRRVEEHRARMRRLRPDVLSTFYVRCIGSMESELEEYPAYDRRKQELRYRIVGDLAVRFAPVGGTVVDVGCASAIVLDRLAAERHTRGVGFDLARHGVHQRAARPDPPVLAQAVVEAIPLPDELADLVVFSEVVEHLVDAYAGLREIGRITRPGGIMLLTTNNASEMPEVSPLHDPLQWVERLVARRRPSVLGFRNITWPYPINPEVDPLPRRTPTYAPHLHFTFSELRDLAEDAGFTLLSSSSFEFPAPQSGLAGRLRRLTERRPGIGDAVADAVESVVARTPGLRMMGTHHCLVFRRDRPPLPSPRRPWWLAELCTQAPAERAVTMEGAQAVAATRR